MELVTCSIRVMICLFSASLDMAHAIGASLISGYATRITTLASETNICFIVPVCYFLTTTVLEGVCVFLDRSGEKWLWLAGIRDASFLNTHFLLS
jgi:hypothetical protein